MPRWRRLPLISTARALAPSRRAAVDVIAPVSPHLVFSQQPTNETAGKPFVTQPIVEAFNGYNELYTNLSSPTLVTITLSSGTGLMFGQLTMDIGSAAGAGIATFTNLQINTAGTKVLTATAPGLTQTNTRSITITGTPQRYAFSADYMTGNSPQGITLGDFRCVGDQRDIAVANSADNTVSIFDCYDDGTFGLPFTFGAGLNPVAVQYATLNGTAYDDIVVTDQGTDTISILKNASFGFSQPFPFAIDTTSSAAPVAVCLADFNRDGNFDIATANSGDNTVGVILGNGGASFGSPNNYSVGSEPNGIFAADVTGDHVIDIITANAGDGTVTVLPGVGDGTFGSPLSLTLFPGGAPQPVQVFAADLNKDGLKDLVTVNYGSNTVSVFTNAGSGTFVWSTNYSVGTQPISYLYRDLDGDGISDLAVVNSGSGTISILLGQKDGTFIYDSTTPVEQSPSGIAGSHFMDGELATDLAVVNSGANDVSASCFIQPPSPINASVAVKQKFPDQYCSAWRAISRPTHTWTYIIVSAPTNGALATTGTASTYTYTPNANFTGLDSFTFQLSDGSVTSQVAKVSINVFPVNHAPSFTLPPSITVAENEGNIRQTNFVTSINSGSTNLGTTVTFSLSTTNPAFFTTLPQISSTGTLTFRVKQNVNGTNYVHVALSNNQGTNYGGTNQSASQVFQIIVGPVDLPPQIAAITAKSLIEDTSTNFNFTVTDLDKPISGLTITAYSSNQGIVTNTGLVAAYVGSSWNLSITPVHDMVGTVTITNVADDHLGGFATNKFTLTILPINHAPSFTLPNPNLTILEDSPAQSITGFATNISRGPANESAQILTFTITDTNAAFFPFCPPISSAGKLTFTPRIACSRDQQSYASC